MTKVKKLVMLKRAVRNLKRVEERQLMVALDRADLQVVFSFLRQGWAPSRPLSGTNSLNLTSSVAIAKCLVRAGANLDAHFAHLPPLNVHSAAGNEKLVNYLLRAGANPNTAYAGHRYGVDPKGTTALMKAAIHGHTRIAKRLLAGGADLDLLDEHGRNALFYALHGNKSGTVKELLRQGAKLTDEALCGPVKHGNTALVSLLIEKGANVNALFKRIDEDKLWPDGETLLGYAITHVRLPNYPYPNEILELLIEAGADVNKPSKCLYLRKNGLPSSGRVPPLRIAGSRGLEDVMHLLWKAGAKGTLKDALADCLPERAAFHNNLRVMRMLIKAGIQIDVPGEGGKRPIEHAIANGHAEMVRLLKSAGAEE